MAAGSTFDAQVGANVRRLRESLGLTQSELAAKVMGRVVEGAPSTTVFRQQTIDRIERGVQTLKLHEALVMAEALECSVDVLSMEPVAPFDRVLAIRGLITEYLDAEERLSETVTKMLTLQAGLRFHAAAGEGALPASVLEQLNGLSSADVSALVRHVVANYVPEAPQHELDGVRDAHPSGFDRRG